MDRGRQEQSQTRAPKAKRAPKANHTYPFALAVHRHVTGVKEFSPHPRILHCIPVARETLQSMERQAPSVRVPARRHVVEDAILSTRVVRVAGFIKPNHPILLEQGHIDNCNEVIVERPVASLFFVFCPTHGHKVSLRREVVRRGEAFVEIDHSPRSRTELLEPFRIAWDDVGSRETCGGFAENALVLERLLDGFGHATADPTTSTAIGAVEQRSNRILGQLELTEINLSLAELSLETGVVVHCTKKRDGTRHKEKKQATQREERVRGCASIGGGMNERVLASGTSTQQKRRCGNRTSHMSVRVSAEEDTHNSAHTSKKEVPWCGE